MTPGNRLFSNGDLADTLNHQLGQIANAVAGWSENELLTLPQADVYEALRARFIIDPIVLDRDGITAEPIEDGLMATRHFGETVNVKVTTVTLVVPITGDQALLGLRPNHYTHNPPTATVRSGELRVNWSGPVNPDPSVVQQGVDKQLSEIQQWIDWSTAQVTVHNEAAGQRIVREVQARRERALANRDLQASLGFPMRKRSDADTYTVPITRRRIVPRRTTPTAQPFRPEPALDEKQYEAALEVLWHQRNQLERAPTTVAKMGEEQIRDLLLVHLNGHFEGQAAGEVFNNVGKTDILIRVEDRHIFIGECKIWRGPKTITDTLDQLLSYLTWRDTKAALVLFIRSGVPSEAIAKAVVKFREHPSYKREGRQVTGERHDFVFTATSDPNQEIKLAFLPFHLPKPRSNS
ncbi:hypothetical protein GCM10010425_30730 [Streptomyces spororaveus]|uniref:Restriction endonuclease n=1 Tax=Streptomyces spororaveus TaxID=284039 RepID=A0ABQ3T674_9ACTN|nr:hypothetical protein [Streptomyces spororaveus]GHI75896.1 hypothetical protein Sspor_14570 [Streptomyces spororaveus]